MEPESIASKTESTSSSSSEMPYTISVLDTPNDGKCYVIGTAHFSVESQKEVAELIRKVQPSIVVLELCGARSNILKLDEETVLREAKEMTTAKMIELIKKHSVVHGVLQSLLIRLYAKITQELGLAPGGEFRVAYNEAMKIPNCMVTLGDMPVNITLKRGFHSLPWYRKLKLAWVLLTTDHKLTKEDIEELKKSDMLDALVKEFGESFPEFKKVLIDERDMYLTQSLRNAYQKCIRDSSVRSPRVVGVVGLGHVAGIKLNWDKDFDIHSIIMEKKATKPSAFRNYGKHIKYSLLLGTLGLVAYQFIKYTKSTTT